MRGNRSHGNFAWPEGYGFSIVGDGPCYVISVEKGGIAYKAGISPGDQLLELDGHNVTDMSCDAIKTLARHSKTCPPTLGVVSRMTYVEILANQRWGYGFQAKGVTPTVVESVDPPGPAYETGVRPGDYILEVNGKELRSLSLLYNHLATKHGKVTLTLISRDGGLARSKSHDSSKNNSHKSSRVRQARDLCSKMNLMLGSDYEKKMTVLRLLRQYADDRDVQKYATSLNLVLVTSHDRRLLTDLRPFIPLTQRREFDDITNYTSGPELGRLKVNTSSLPSYLRSQGSANQGAKNVGLLSIDSHNASKKRVRVVRDDGSYGFVLCGSSPVYIESVLPGGPAHRAALHQGDCILAVDGVDVRIKDFLADLKRTYCSKCSHSHLVRILQNSGDKPKIEVLPAKAATLPTRKGDDVGKSHDASQHTMFSHSSHQTDSSWLSDSNLTLDGLSFKDKVHELLNTSEKQALRAALIEFNMTRNVAELVDAGNSVLDTPAKRSLWVFLLPRMNTQQQQYVFRYVDIPQQLMEHVMSKASRSPRETTVSFDTSLPNTSENRLSSDVTDHGFASENHVGSQSQRDTFKQKRDYLLTSREKLQLKHALEVYAEKRNLQYLMGDLWDILDTPSKKTLWTYIMPLLSPSHQKIAQATVGLPAHLLPAAKESETKSSSKARGGVLPKYGDILMLQNEFDGSFHHRRQHIHHLENSSDEDVDDLAPRYGGSSATNSPLHSHSTSVDSSVDNRYRSQFENRKPRSYKPFSPQKKVQYPSSDVEQSTMTINPIYADTASPDRIARPKTKMVREEVTQTTPAPSPAPSGIPGYSRVVPNLPGYTKHASGIPGLPALSESPRNSPSLPRSQSTPATGDFRTIVNVYDPSRRQSEILSYNSKSSGNLHEKLDPIPETGKSLENLIDTGTYEEPVGLQKTSMSYTNIDDVGLQESQTLEPFYHTLDSPEHKNSSIQQSFNRYTTQRKTPPWRRKNQNIDLVKNESGSRSRSNSPAHCKGAPVIGDEPLATVSVSELKARLYQSAAAHTNSGRINKYHSAQDGVVNKLFAPHSPTNSKPASPTSPRSVESAVGQIAQNGSDTGRSLSDSYHTKAMNAIRSLDEAVANEQGADPGHHVTHTIPKAPPLPPPGTPPTGARMNVKRMNWEKISTADSRTVWAKIDRSSDELADIVKYLELEQQFSTRKNRVSESFRDRKNENYILNPKKAYNISILLGHLKLPVKEVKDALLSVDETLLSTELLKQMLAYAPDGNELEKYNKYTDSVETLSKPDQFMYELSRVPGYEMRLKAILFKGNFDEKVDEIKQSLQKIKKAARELQKSEKLAKVLELVLAMGNYLNKGSVRVGRAAGFRVAFLQQLELTKTSDGKASFLHVLADAVKAKCPELLTFGEELPSVQNVVRVTSEAMHQEINELRKVVEEITEMVRNVDELEHNAGMNDRFHRIMRMFIATASDKITGLSTLHQETMNEIQDMAVYFGENRNYKNPEDIFKIFGDFITKFEKAHRQNLITKRPDRNRNNNTPTKKAFNNSLFNSYKRRNNVTDN